MLFASRCPACRQAVRGSCSACWSSVRPADPVAGAALEFTGVGRDLLIGFKFGNARTLARPFARRLVDDLARAGSSPPGPQIDCVTWAPTSPRRARRRGYDQAELLAREVARLLGVRCRRLLRRAGRSVAQTGRSRHDRAIGPAFVGRAPAGVCHVLVVDDVITTGATLDAARLALIQAGVPMVTCRAAAATPAPPSSPARPGRRGPGPVERPPAAPSCPVGPCSPR